MSEFGAGNFAVSDIMTIFVRFRMAERSPVCRAAAALPLRRGVFGGKTDGAPSQGPVTLEAGRMGFRQDRSENY
jgi:hypothetical protein